MKFAWYIVVGAVAALANHALSNILIVPDQYTTIQAAIDACSPNDTVMARAGLYAENLSVEGRDLTLASEFILNGDTTQIPTCIIRPGNDLRCLSISGNTGMETVHVIGLTFRGNAPSGTGGGIEVHLAHLDMRWCLVDSSSNSSTGGLRAVQSSVRVSDCRFRRCGSFSLGNVLKFFFSPAIIERSEIAYTLPAWDSGSTEVMLDHSDLTLRECSLHELGWQNSWGTICVDPDDSSRNIRISKCQITHSRINEFFGSGMNNGPVEIHFDSNEVRSNQFSSDLFSAGSSRPRTDFFALDNIFSDNTSPPDIEGAMFFSLGRTGVTAVIRGNLFLRNFNHAYSCLAISHGDTASAGIEDVSYNYFIGNSSHSSFAPSSVVYLSEVGENIFHHNFFSGNLGFAVTPFLHQEPFSNALHCWWGDATGPTNPTNPLGRGDTVDTAINFIPFETDTSFMHPESGVASREPVDYVLGFIYPNPFNSSTTIEFVVTNTERIKLEIFDVLGRRVETLVDGMLTIGVHRATWFAGDHASGIYFARLSSEGSEQKPGVQKMALLK